MKLLTLAVVCFLTPLHFSFAASGYVKVEEAQVPESVKTASKSVFYFSSVAGDSTDLKLSNLKDVNNFERRMKSYENSFALTQLEFCKKNNRSICHVFTSEGDGSAFVFRDSHTVATSLHNVIEQMTAFFTELPCSSVEECRHNFNPLHSKRLLMSLASNGNADPLFDGLQMTAYPKFFSPIRYVLSHSIDGFDVAMGQWADYIEIGISKDIGVPLEPASTPPKIGDTVYIIGFPTKTDFRKDLGLNDADGESKYIATGKIVSKKQSGIDDNLGSQFQSIQEKLILYVATDVEDGFSGGPVVDRDGHVLGVFSRIYHKAETNEVGTAVRIIKHDELTKIWQDLDRSY
jgi:Trypsin-like peptidase domain